MAFQKPTVGIFLGGGGFKVAAQIGWLESLIPKLIEKKFKITYFGVVSGGAFNGAKLNEAKTQEELIEKIRDLKTIWLYIEKRGPEFIFPIKKLTFIKSVRKKALLTGETLRNLIYNFNGNENNINIDAILNSEIQLDIFIHNQLTGFQEIISNKNEMVKSNPETLASAIIASASLPPFFPPVMINGIPYVDGGPVNLTEAIKSGCQIIFALIPHSETGGDDKPPGKIARLFPWVEYSLDFLSHQIRELNKVQISIAKKIAEKHKVKIIPIFIEQKPDTLFMYTFAKGDISRLIENSKKQMDKKLRFAN